MHERGARHLADPSRLVASAERIYGPDPPRPRFGPWSRLRRNGSEPSTAGRYRPRRADARRPRHARPREAPHGSRRLGDGAVFTGDALGIHPPDAPVSAGDASPDYDLELAVSSIRAIRERARGSKVLFSHFGPVDEVDRICELAERRFRSWTEAVGQRTRADRRPRRDRPGPRTRRARDVETGVEATLDLDWMETLSSVRMNAMGIVRTGGSAGNGSGGRARRRDQAS